MADLQERLQTLLSERYTVDRRVGRGGMASVYLAQDRKHDRPVAIKVLHPELGASLGAERFLREIRLAARLQHPHILPIHDSGEAPGLLWFSMPYVDGESLRERLTRDPQLPVDEAIDIAREVADALEYAHGRSIVHRDIKPENILLSQGHALVTDFGIAAVLGGGGGEGGNERITEAGMALGTPAYMSPEQASGETRLDRRSDVYSLGCVLYEMLAGEAPFGGATTRIVIARRFTEPPPSVIRYRPEIPPALERTVARALATAPADRFPTAAHFAAALQACAMRTAPTDLTGPVGDAPSPRSVAVLPFANLSVDPENEYFADGMTDELINALAKVRGLHVVSRTSVFAFKGKLEDVRAIGQRLRVRTVLEGSVRRAGTRLRLSAQLISVEDGYLLWSEVFDRDAGDVFAIQDEISRAIAKALEVRIFSSTGQALVKPATDDLEAYTLYLKGRHFWNRRGEQDLRRGLAYFEQAVERDPGYALAHAGVADSYAVLGFYSALPPDEAFPRAKTAGLTALSLDPTLAEAHPALAYVAMYYEWDWLGAEREFRTAIELNPGYATAHQWLGNYLAIQGRAEESFAEFEQAVALDPLSPLKLAALGWGYYWARQYERAVTECRRALELDPTYVVAQFWLGLATAELGRLDEAIVAFEEAARLTGRSVASLGFLGYGYAIAGRTVQAEQIVDELVGLSGQRYVSPYDLGVIHHGLGDRNAALAWLERAFKERDHQMAFLKVEPRLDGLRGEPRFEALMRGMGW